MQDGSSNRRDFLGRGLAAGAAAGLTLSAMTASSRARTLGAGERINLGLIGCGGRMGGLVNYAKAADDNLRVTAVCDVWEQKRDRWTAQIEKLFGQSRSKCVYAYTTVVSPRDQRVLMLVNKDDNAQVWINGKLAFEDLRSHPAEGYMGRERVWLKKGENRILARITQRSRRERTNLMETPNYWQFRLRLRKSDHVPAEVWGK